MEYCFKYNLLCSHQIDYIIIMMMMIILAYLSAGICLSRDYVLLNYCKQKNVYKYVFCSQEHENFVLLLIF